MCDNHHILRKSPNIWQANKSAKLHILEYRGVRQKSISLNVETSEFKDIEISLELHLAASN